MATEHFSREELMCPCCEVMGMDEEFLQILEAIRKEYGKPMILNSSYRCSKYNSKVHGTPRSSHCAGLAVDIRCTGSRNRFDLVRHISKHITRIGIGDGFVHIDNDLSKSPNVIWTYY